MATFDSNGFQEDRTQKLTAPVDLISQSDKFLQLVEKAERGEISQIPLMHSQEGRDPYKHLSKLGQMVPYGAGIYISVGGPSGCGKTAFVDHVYALLPLYMHWKHGIGKDIEICYFILERPLPYKIAKWSAWYMFVEHYMHIDVPIILNWYNKKRTMTPEEKEKLVEAQEFIKFLQDKVTIFHGPQTVESIWILTTNWLLDKKRQKDSIKIRFTDHVNDIEGTRNLSIFDQHFLMAKKLRDEEGMGFVEVSQFNREIESEYRKENIGFSVKKSDWFGSSKVDQVADVMIGLLDPHKIKKGTDTIGYEVDSFVDEMIPESRYRSMKVVKNSYGGGLFNIGQAMLGEMGYFCDIPPPNLITETEYMAIKNAQLYNFIQINQHH